MKNAMKSSFQLLSDSLYLFAQKTFIAFFVAFFPLLALESFSFFINREQIEVIEHSVITDGITFAVILFTSIAVGRVISGRALSIWSAYRFELSILGLSIVFSVVYTILLFARSILPVIGLTVFLVIVTVLLSWFLFSFFMLPWRTVQF